MLAAGQHPGQAIREGRALAFVDMLARGQHL